MGSPEGTEAFEKSGVELLRINPLSIYSPKSWTKSIRIRHTRSYWSNQGQNKFELAKWGSVNPPWGRG